MSRIVVGFSSQTTSCHSFVGINPWPSSPTLPTRVGVMDAQLAHVTFPVQDDLTDVPIQT